MSDRVCVPDFIRKKRQGERIAVLTAYDATMARLFDRAGVDALLVGDSVGMVALGYASTIPVTLDTMVHHTAAVARGTERALVVADMPFMTFQVGVEDAMRNAARLVQEAGAAAVKVEGAGRVLEVVHRLTEAGVPVMGHLGLLPQSVHRVGGYRTQATTAREQEALVSDAVALEQAGAFAIVLEHIPEDVAGTVTRRVAVPTIGIGAGADCDGQVLVGPDMLGLFDRVPPFVKRYAQLSATVTGAARSYVADVRSGAFPPVRTREKVPSA
ncbi:MAG: 3-methyl-2-oxobutanoate hydroxymethyltransferase [Acidimicrobiia bacterium]|nr:3-methyl-2-oxobutanoate hydroxymethyltransferase [Acidimicrobiia bacterium]